MLIFVWTLGLLLVALWSAAMWAVHLGWTMLAALPWSQAAEAIRDLQLPGWLELWFGEAWRALVQALAPTLEWALRVLQGSDWLHELVPIALWVVWGLGVLFLLTFTALAGVVVDWFRRRRGSVTAT